MDPERRGNFLTRVLGIETFRHIREGALARDDSQVEAVLYASGVTAMYYLFPLSHQIGFPRESDSSVSKKRALALIVLDTGFIIGAFVAGVGFKMAYNLGVEVARYAPDALRAVRRSHPPA